MLTENITVLDKINSPDDVKKLNIEEMNLLAEDIRAGILNRVNLVGGHLGPGLGFVEATIAMHYVFNSPVDKFVFDVSHQCYPHKMLTGRKEGFIDPLNHLDISGYTNPKESAHDNFMVGHTSTAVSLATGIAKARDLKCENYNVVAVVGDGSLSGGETFGGLNNASELNSNFIIILNDNEMCIAENHGGLYNALAELRETQGQSENNIFKAFGFDYYYEENGNDIESLINLFSRVKDTTHPTIVHIHTLKGKGYEPAIIDKERGHWDMPHFLDRENNDSSEQENYYTITNQYFFDKLKTDKTLMVVSAATPGATGLFKPVRDKLGKNYTDVSIEEEHAIAYISGMAKNGAKPVLEIMSSFIQRTYDQLSQDLALNNSPATILVCWGGISAADATHLNIFDIPLISNIPNIVYLAPTNKEEYLKMLDWSVEQTSHPVAIRMPNDTFISTGIEDNTDYSILNKYQTVENGSEVAILGVGDFFHLAKDVKDELKSKLRIDATLINPKFISGLDKELLDSLKSNHKIVITLESGIIEGGFGQKIASYYGSSDVKVLNYGAKKEFTDRVPLDVIYRENHLTKEQITDDVSKLLK